MTSSNQVPFEHDDLIAKEPNLVRIFFCKMVGVYTTRAGGELLRRGTKVERRRIGKQGLSVTRDVCELPYPTAWSSSVVNRRSEMPILRPIFCVPREAPRLPEIWQCICQLKELP